MLNPYIAGSPVVEASMFFGREDVFGWIERSLAGKYVDHILVLHGQRRVGKTSVLKQIPNFLPDRYIQVFFDLQGRTGTTLERFLWWLASEITRTLKREHGIDLPKPDRKDFEDPETLINGFLPGIRTKLGDDVLLLTFDEFDSLDRPEIQERLSRPLIAYLRRLIEVEGLNFIFSIGSSGDKLENMQASYTDFFKSALYRKISFLTKDDIQRLVTKPVEGLIQYEAEAVRRIGEITSGHPYFTQLMCHELFSRCQKTGARKISAEDVEAVLEDVVERGTVNLKFIWDEASDLEKWILATLAQMDGGSNQELAQALTEQHVRFSEPDLNSATLHLRDKDILRDDNRFVIHLMRLWLVANRPIERVREELEEVNPIANRFIEIGDEYRDRGETQQAIAYYQQALNMNPGDLKAQNNIASVHLEQRDYEEAVQAFEAALKVDDEDVVAKTGYCAASLALGEQAQERKAYEDAIHYYQQVLEINPNHVEAQERSTKLQKLVDDYKEAQQAIREKRYERAVELLQGIIVVDPTYKATTRLLTEAVEARQAIPFWRRRWLLPVAGILVLVVLGVSFAPQAWNAFSAVFRSFPSGEGTTASIDEETLPAGVTDVSPTFTEPVAVISPTPTFPVFQIALDYIENEAPTYQTGFDTWDFGDPIENASLESGKLLLSNARISLDQFNFSSDRFAVEFELRLLEGDMYSDCFFESDNGQGGDLKKSMLARYYHGGLGETFLQTWGYGKSESGRSFNFSETKTATVIVVGDQIASFVNGQLAGTTLHTDGSIVYTQQYLGARNITCEFDNFKFWNLDVVEFSTSTFNSKSEPTSIALSIAQLAEEFAEPIFTAIENREPDIQEDFNVDQPVESNWEFRGGDTKGKIEIENGVLLVHMFVKGNDDIVNEMMNEKMNFNNFVLKVDIDLTDLGTGHIMFNSRNNEKDENVSFEFDPTASASSDKWSVGLYNSNGSTNLAGGETTYTGKVTVTIISNGSEYAVFINDIPRTYIYDTGQSPGINGKEIDFKLYSDPESTVRFDNLKIWNLDGMEFSTAPTPTITPTPEPPAAFYEPIRAYIESQSPTFEDDFEVKNDLWGTTSEDIAISTLIDRGELNIFDNVELNEDNSSTNDRNGLGVTFPVNGLLSAKDFAIKFDFHMEYAGGSEADFGVVFRSKPFTHSSAGNSGYTIKFFSIGSWELIQNEDETLLATGSFGQKDMQFSGRVLLIVREQNLAVYMNEILLYDDSVLSVPETSITNGFTVEGTAVKFRFVEFWNLNGVEFSTPLSTPTSN